MAARIRTLMVIRLVPPTGRISFSWMARSSLACKIDRQLSDFIEKNRAAFRDGQQAVAGLHRPVNAPFT